MNESATLFLPSESRSILEISSSALRHNLSVIKALSNDSDLGIVVKSDAYGHGMKLLIPEFEMNAHVPWLCTAGIDEAIMVRRLGWKKHLLSMAYNDLTIEEAIHHAIDVTLDDECLLNQFNDAAVRMAKSLRVHVKVDTGLGRLGIVPHQVLSLFDRLKKDYPAVSVVGLFTHLADTNNPDQTYTYHQLAIFNDVINNLVQAGFELPYTHALSSGGLTLGKENSSPTTRVIDSRSSSHRYSPRYSMVRVGTNAYGLYKSEVQKERFQRLELACDLKPILAWKSLLGALRSIDAGFHAFSGHRFDASKPMTVGIIPVGYYDGYPSMLAHRANVLIGAHKARVLSVAAETLLVDLTAVTKPRIGDHVVLIGDFPGITASQLAEQAETINNELLTRLNPHIPRILVD